MVDEFVVDRVARLTLHDVRLTLFVRQRDGGHLDRKKRRHILADRVSSSAQTNKTSRARIARRRRASHQISSQVDAEDGDGSKRQRHVSEDEEQEGRDLGDVGRQRVRDRLLEVVEDKSPLLDTRHDRCKVVVEQDHVGRLFAHVTSGDPHGNSCSTRS